MSAELPEWLTVGADVAILSDRYMGRPSKPTRAKVAKIGKRDIVLDDGQRFRVRDLARDNGGGAWNTVYYRLFAPNDPQVAKELAEWRRGQMVAKAQNAAYEFARGKDGIAAAEVILALAPLTGRADEIAALFAKEPTP